MLRSRSVLRDHRTTPAIVDANGHHIGIAVNAVGAENRTGGERGERRVVVGDEQMIVFNGCRPVRGEAEFDAAADRATPTVVARGCRHNDAAGEDVVAIGNNGRAALEIEQRCVPGVPNLAGEQPERVDAGAIDARVIVDADIAALQVGPITLEFKSIYPGAGLPTETNLRTSHAARRAVASVRRAKDTRRREQIEATVRRAPAAVGAYREAAPVVGDRDHHGCFVGLRRKIRSRRGRSDPDDSETNNTEQEPLHSNSLRPISSLRFQTKRLASTCDRASRSYFGVNDSGAREQKQSPKCNTAG